MSLHDDVYKIVIWLNHYNDNNNGPNGYNLFYVGGDIMMRRGMLPIIMLPDGDLRIVCVALSAILNFDYLRECSHWNQKLS